MKKMSEFVYRCCFWSFVYSASMMLNMVIYSLSRTSATVVFGAACILGLAWVVMWIIRMIRRCKALKAGKNASGSDPAENGSGQALNPGDK